MIIVLKPGTSEQDIQQVADAVKKFNYEPRLIRGVERTVVACIGDERNHHTLESLIVFPQVESVTPIQKKYKLVSREYQARDTVLDVPGRKIGGGTFHVVAGPCSVEKPGANFGNRESGEVVRRNALPWRRIQAPHLAVRLSGIGPRRA